MEAWKFINYSSLSPVFALSFTTERWGLDALPGNLIATTGYWNKTNSSEANEDLVWALPYSCSSNSSDYFDVFYHHSEFSDTNSSVNNSSDFSLAFAPASAPQSVPL